MGDFKLDLNIKNGRIFLMFTTIQTVYVAVYTKEGLKFQMVLGPLKFSARGESAFGGEPLRGERPHGRI